MTKEQIINLLENNSVECDIQGHGWSKVVPSSWFATIAQQLATNGGSASVSGSYCKDDLRVAFEQARCNKHSFEDWYEFNYR